MEYISDFLSFYPKEHTWKNYRSALYNFFDHLYEKQGRKRGGRLSDVEKACYEELAAQYFGEDRDYFRDVAGYLNFMSNRPPKTLIMHLAAVRRFLTWHGVRLDDEVWKQLRKLIHGSSARTREKDLSKEDVRKIILNVDSVLGKALFVFMVSTGTRIGEALQITFADLDVEGKRVNIRGETTKSGDPRLIFFNDEAWEFLEQWLELRPKYRKRGVKSGSWNPETDPRVFPITYPTAYRMLKTALSRLGWDDMIDPSTGRLMYRIHQARKYNRTTLGYHGLSRDVIEAIIGHKEGQDAAYRRYTKKQLEDAYRRVESALNIFDVGVDVQEISSEVESYKRIIRSQEKEIEKLVASRRETDLQIKEMEKRLDRMEELLKK